ncbi:RNA methyltransferase, partial [Flavobacteriaceae bacterium]|nr:RNA methyltransferase [Flavobacteriaceae bacterium]
NWKLLGVWLLLKGEGLPNWEELKGLEKLAISLPLDLKTNERKIRHSIPDWLDESAVETFGEAEWEKEIKVLNTTAPLVIRVNDLKTTPEKLIKIVFRGR